MSLYKPVHTDADTSLFHTRESEEEISDFQDGWEETENVLSNQSSSDDSNNLNIQHNGIIKIISSSSAGSSGHSQSPFVCISGATGASPDTTLVSSSNYWNFPALSHSTHTEKRSSTSRAVYLDHYERLSPSFLTLNYLTPILFSLTPGQRARLQDLTTSMIPTLRIDQPTNLILPNTRFPDIPSILKSEVKAKLCNKS
ncbi:hypothetical protein DAKH74_015750 [Maudiozyma humilis]|uniref:Uncharacterized protein n=1 Tax=Maudiozyma humilis TaxID=51915 RepID=A0AAV5RTK2_MAUHU|nr:hypothetical protein DAKH74_015750 [Kazachstania humilis]